ncbi:Na(+)/citrate cotransporter-like [Eublepharis macularius]|uniref:Na(+)/citrate cotransporter-like n=1 Tax=Eublepharis macularius TaxID=481883 RepID=A0AA97KIP1_EUBMA|nr:Na(+)/citrate cotransporter-like [Eublepharis macularius]
MPAWRQLLRYTDFLVLVGTPLALLPLPLLIPTSEVECGFIIILMAVYWCTEVIPSAVTALLPAVLFPLFGIVESQKVCIQYLKDANMLFIGDLIVAAAVEHWNLHKRIALKVLLTVGVKPARNTVTTSMMVPIVQAILDQMDSSEEGTLFTASVMSVDQGIAASEQDHLKKRLSKGMTLCICYAATIGGTATLTGTGTNVVLKGQIDQLFPDNKDILNFASWFAFAFPNMLLMLLLAWLWLQFSFVGFHFKKTPDSKTEKSKKEAVIFNLLKREYLKLGPVSFAEFNVLMLFILLILLWLTRDPGFIPGWASLLFGKKKKYVTDATAALFVSVLLFVIPSSKPRCGTSSDPEAMKRPFFPPPLLDWKMVQKDVSWNVILLIGGGFALAHGSEASGLFKWLGAQMVSLHTVPPWAIALIISVVVAIFTECASNMSTATLFLPVFASLSQSIEINPLYAMISCTLSASFAFMLPVATPPNAIVFSYGHLRILDMAKNGAVMNLIGILCASVALNTWGRFLFNLDVFPPWARANVTSSV